MMGIFVLAYFAIATGLGVVSCYFLVKIVVSFRRKKDWPRFIPGLLLTAVPFVVVTWPFLAGRLLFEAQCAMESGLLINRTVDASQTGYFLDGAVDRERWQAASSHPYAHQAVADLISGRIAFFEVRSYLRPDRPFRGSVGPSSYLRVFLTDKHSRVCKNYRETVQDLKLPKGMCLASERVSVLESQYEIRGYVANNGRRPLAVKLVDRASRTTLVSFTRRELDRSIFGTLSCPKGPNDFFSPLSAISTVTLHDSQGKTLTLEDFSALRSQARMQERYPRAVLADGSTGNQKGANGQECLAKNFGSAFDTYKISVYSGTGETIPVSLDDSNHQVREVRIVVNNPGQRSALLLNAYDPVVWKIARTQDSEIAGVFANGHHGQAVLGVEHKTPVIMSTKMYSPGSSCAPTEEFEALTALNAAPQGVVVNDGEVFLIGERPYQETSLIVSDERRLEDFSLRRIEVKEARPRSDR